MSFAEALWPPSRRLPLFRRNLQHYRGISAQSVQSAVIYRALWRPDLAAPRRQGAHCYNRHFCKLLSPWPIDDCLKVAHLSAMAATICKSSDYSSEGWQVRKRTPPLARERRNLRSESNVFYRLLFGRIAPFPCRSARPARILDSVGRSGLPGQGPQSAR